MWPIRIDMNVVPRNVVDQVYYFQAHLTPWADHASEIGSSPEEVAAMADKVAATRDALRAQAQAQAAARSATLRVKIAAAKMADAGALIIMKAKTKAAAEGDQIYSLAMIPRPAHPSPIGEPDTPHSFSLELAQVGILTIKWKCKNPRGSKGTTYQIYRQVGSSGHFEYLGATGAKHFADMTVPKGAASVTYRIQALRSTRAGAVANFTVSLTGHGFAPGMMPPTNGRSMLALAPAEARAAA